MRRWLLTVLGFLLLGAVVNVAVAWGAMKGRLGSQTVDWPLREADATWREYAPERAYPWVFMAIREQGFGFDRAWMMEADSTSRTLSEIKSGWPFRSVSVVLLADEHGTECPVEGALVPNTGLPIGPVGSGFTMNTLFYAVLLWLPICGPFSLRRQIRKRRNQCLRCGYPVGASSTCTECGGAILPKRRHGT